MKNLYESILSGTNHVLDSTNIVMQDVIKDWICDIYAVNRDFLDVFKDFDSNKYKVDVDGDIRVKIRGKLKVTSLTNGMFEFNEIQGDFDCSNCRNLKSLQGAPRSVKNTFRCQECDSLIDLQGAPEEVGEHFLCSMCKKLKSLQGAPRIVNWTFDCGDCKNLLSLQGAPDECGLSFECRGCTKIKDLQGAPKRVTDIFDCGFCSKLESLNGLPNKCDTIFVSYDAKLKDFKELSSRKMHRIYLSDDMNFTEDNKNILRQLQSNGVVVTISKVDGTGEDESIL